jgi:hypothetical protein
MALLMDYHEDLKPPAEALAQIAENTSHARADRFGVPCGEVHQVGSLTWPGRTE